jgi:hypothetical protein
VTLGAPEVRPPSAGAAGPAAAVVPRPAPVADASVAGAAEVRGQVRAGGAGSDGGGTAGAGQLPRTGGIAGMLLALSLLAWGTLLRRLKRRA